MDRLLVLVTHDYSCGNLSSLPLYQRACSVIFLNQIWLWRHVLCRFQQLHKILQNELFGHCSQELIDMGARWLVINSVIPMALALLLNREFRGKSIALGAMLIPWLTPVVGFAMMSKWLLEPEMGVVNIFLKNIGLINKGINFIGSRELAFPTVILLNFGSSAPSGSC